MILVLGSGGKTGGRFIDGAVSAICQETGWDPSSAAIVIGTSIGGFRAGSLGERTPLRQEWAEALAGLASPLSQASRLDRITQQLRVRSGRMLCRIIPRGRDQPDWRTPNPPYHRGAFAISMDVNRRTRVINQLATSPTPGIAISASGAIPFVYGPVELGDSSHSDGAVWSPTHADLAAELSDPGLRTTVIVIAPQVPRQGGRVLDRVHRRQLRAELGSLQNHVRVLVICPEAGPKEETRTEARGAAAVEALLQAAKQRARW